MDSSFLTGFWEFFFENYGIFRIRPGVCNDAVFLGGAVLCVTNTQLISSKTPFFIGRTQFDPQIWEYGKFSVTQTCIHFVALKRSIFRKIIFFLFFFSKNVETFRKTSNTPKKRCQCGKYLSEKVHTRRNDKQIVLKKRNFGQKLKFWPKGTSLVTKPCILPIFKKNSKDFGPNFRTKLSFFQKFSILLQN